MDHSGEREFVALLQAKEPRPSHGSASARPRQPSSPDPPRCHPKTLEAMRFNLLKT